MGDGIETLELRHCQLADIAVDARYRRRIVQPEGAFRIKVDVDPDHLVTGLTEHLRQDRSDITTMSGNQDFHHSTPTFSTVLCLWTKVRRAASFPAACPCIAKKSGAGSRRAGHRRRASRVAPAPPSCRSRRSSPKH